ncbi:hypothetical protein CVO74_11490 [Xanthomonas prunicola]|uniref:Fido domain-containing protein n=1 Tax=Xanthomonas prunicola TaxID=2053930 RepID=A0A2N3RLN8_9XANT|nr:hypothetical protein XpruCFBP8353_09435 [Xanthomonas prunicola]PKV17689.1 hypothetical protein XpruCFBP8354_09435 [Xanthomonas prunicola]PKV21587.1 hypothetical protein CVO74_11490 [Xanthomonas prunicola]
MVDIHEVIVTGITIRLAEFPALNALVAQYSEPCNALESRWGCCSKDERLRAILYQARRDLAPDNHAIRALRCRLSAYFLEATTGMRTRDSSTELERDLCAEMVGSNASAFQFTSQWVESVAGRIGQRIRTTDAIGSSDRDGHHVVYPNAQMIAERLEAISIYASSATQWPVLQAIVTSSLVLNLHPLTDGNGRLARLSFNALASRHNSSSFYLPLFELAEASAGGWIFATRMAWQRNDWQALITFFAASIALFSPSGNARAIDRSSGRVDA